MIYVIIRNCWVGDEYGDYNMAQYVEFATTSKAVADKYYALDGYDVEEYEDIMPEYKFIDDKLELVVVL